MFAKFDSGDGTAVALIKQSAESCFTRCAQRGLCHGECAVEQDEGEKYGYFHQRHTTSADLS